MTLMNYTGIYALVTLGLVLLTGVGGLTSFGQAAFVGMPADDRADEGPQPDDEAGIVIERRRRADQDAGDAGERRGDRPA